MTTSTEPQFTMYSTTWCGYCSRLKTQLEKAGIAYAEVDIERDPEAAAFVRSVNSGNEIVPTLRFHDDTTFANPPLSKIKEKLAQ